MGIEGIAIGAAFLVAADVGKWIEKAQRQDVGSRESTQKEQVVPESPSDDVDGATQEDSH